jgi:uncharacterized protein YfaS (alpha-2-macroglobulin family)
VEYLLKAKKAGIEVNQEIISQAKSYLEGEKFYDQASGSYQDYSREEIVSRIYALTLLGSDKGKKPITDFEDMNPDILAMAVMANVRNGIMDPSRNGLEKLMSLRQEQDDGVFWTQGDINYFGSKDGSNGLAIRAILTANGDYNIATKAVRYLTRNRRSEYWSNTFATAQVVQALVDYSRKIEGTTPNYTYTVLVDGNEIAKETVKSLTQKIGDIKIPAEKINSMGSAVTLLKVGDGQIYSTLVVNEFRTDRNVEAVDRGLTVKREYVNEKGRGYSLAVGDTVIVNITMGGLKGEEKYAVISDELPSGLIPINTALINEQANQDRNWYYSSYDVTDRDVTQNGMVLSLYRIGAGEKTYTYRARVLSEGTFIVPPVVASLMYSPEISGRSAAQKVVVTKTSTYTPIVQPSIGFPKSRTEINAFIDILKTIIVLLVIVLAIILLSKRGIQKGPPQPPPPPPPTTV